MAGHDVYLVGSVPLQSASDVFETLARALGSRLRWMPDGETGERLNWVVSLEHQFANNKYLERSGKTFQLHSTAAGFNRYRLKPGISVEQLEFANLGYADWAIASWADFLRLKSTGVIPDHIKFQVDLVPAHSVLWLFLEDDLHAAVDPVYNRAVTREMLRIADAIPHDQFAIQFDVASAVFARLERNEASSYGTDKHEAQERFATILVDFGNQVPADIELLFHFCYGDANHKHVVEPTDMSDMVAMANLLSKRIRRPIPMIHMPVPRDRVDAAYFEPLRQLQIQPATEICLGLIHYTDGVSGARKRLAMARKYLDKFMIGTECGFGRRDPKTIPALLEIHAKVAEEAA